MIIWGWRTIKSTPGTGQFHCPHCSSQRPYRHEKFGRWFTLYFIPIIPLGSAGEQITCSTCSKSWNMNVLANDPQKIKAAQLNRIAGDWISVMAAVAVSRNGLTPRDSPIDCRRPRGWGTPKRTIHGCPRRCGRFISAGVRRDNRCHARQPAVGLVTCR